MVALGVLADEPARQAGQEQHGAGHVQLGAVQVEVAPSQRHDLTTAQPGGGAQAHEQFELGSRCPAAASSALACSGVGSVRAALRGAGGRASTAALKGT